MTGVACTFAHLQLNKRIYLKSSSHLIRDKISVITRDNCFPRELESGVFRVTDFTLEKFTQVNSHRD